MLKPWQQGSGKVGAATSRGNVNTATREQLITLPGVTGAEAGGVIAGRPYDDPGQLVTRHNLRRSKYDKIADRLTAKK